MDNIRRIVKHDKWKTVEYFMAGDTSLISEVEAVENLADDIFISFYSDCEYDGTVYTSIDFVDTDLRVFVDFSDAPAEDVNLWVADTVDALRFDNRDYVGVESRIQYIGIKCMQGKVYGQFKVDWEIK